MRSENIILVILYKKNDLKLLINCISNNKKEKVQFYFKKEKYIWQLDKKNLRLIFRIKWENSNLKKIKILIGINNK